MTTQADTQAKPLSKEERDKYYAAMASQQEAPSHWEERLLATIADLEANLADEERDGLKAIGERDHAQDALQNTHIALGGDGEWSGRLPPMEPPDSGDLHYDVPALAAEVLARAETAERALSDLRKEMEWRPSESAPKDENILIATTGEWVGEARLDYHPHNDNWNWVWAGGSPIHPDLKLLGWRRLPAPITTSGSPDNG